MEGYKEYYESREEGYILEKSLKRGPLAGIVNLQVQNLRKFCSHTC